VEKLTCRLLPFAAADGPHNMAADEALLETALSGVASLRCYTWSEPTLSLGYFQPAAGRDQDRLLSQLPFVRRPTGGGAIVHQFELTYALSVPAGSAWHGKEPWLDRMHAIIAAALQAQGVPARLQPHAVQAAEQPLCFLQLMPGDVMVRTAKVVGSAQRRRKGALLQHGSILLSTSPFAPALSGMRELSGHNIAAPALCELLAAELVRRTDFVLEPAEWSPAEQDRLGNLAQVKYSHDSWNRKR
jgi:lipoate-protein ligase A